MGLIPPIWPWMRLDMEHNAQPISVNGALLFVDVRGAGTPIVLVHSGLTDSSMWEPQVEVLASRHTVVRYDLRGYGRSNLPPGPFSHVYDLRSLLGHLGIERAVLMGASLGGKVAIDFTLEHPDLVERLILLDPALGGHRWSDLARQKWKGIGEAVEAGNIDLAVELEIRMWVDGPGRTPDEVDPAVRRAVLGMNTQVMRRELQDEGVAEELELDPPAIERLAEIAVPMLVIVGEHDLPDMLDIADHLSREVPGAEQVVVAGAAHLPSMERPEEVNRLVAERLGQP
jgi:3-oxoadipate enol-lactonase